MTLCYPGIGGKPIIVACVQCLLTGKGFGVQMIVDTGADETCFPASFAALFGHNNSHPEVVVHKDAIQGIGGTSDTYIHSVRVNLLDPAKSIAKKPVIGWSSVLDRAPFVEKLESPYGLLGMDIICEWKEIKFEPAKKGGLWIKIVV